MIQVFFCLLLSFGEYQTREMTYVKFISEMESETYLFYPDSSVKLSWNKEQWKTKKKLYGKWSQTDSTLKIQTTHETFLFRKDTIKSLQILIDEDSLQEWIEVKRKIITAVEEDEYYKQILSFTDDVSNKPGSTQRIVKRLVFAIASRNIYGKNILLEDLKD